MYQFDAERTGTLRGEHVLTASVLLLVGLGLVTLYSASYAFAERFFNNGLYFISRQLVYGAGGILLFFIASRINLELVRKLIKPLIAGAAVLCCLPFIPGIGVMRNGAARWFGIGSWTYQPSEMVKLVLPLYLAHIFDKKRESIDVFSSGVLPPVLVTTLFFTLIYMQNNFSTAVLIAVNTLVIFFLAGVRYRYFFAAAIMFLPVSALLILTKEHRVRRFISYFRPEWDPLGAGFQVRSSLLTIMSGGFWGKGIGQGTRKIASVPEIQSDFIFSAFAEEAGLLGVALCFILFAVFAFQGYRGAWKSGSRFKRLLAAGLVTSIVSQTLLNIAVVSGSVPATGIPLPFFSAGGSSLATTLVCAGLIVNVSRQGREEIAGNAGWEAQDER
ncbi:MAG: putative lipid II flippase FtsW [Treponema sp.]|jgi:cell division protein FtsW|nr:putative lipid II flippase FtsW [Treponema sp.]